MKILLRTLLVLAAISTCAAQDQPKKHEPVTVPKESAVAAQEQQSKSAYRLDFRIFEIDNGKRTNERAFAMTASVPGGWSRLNVGTRVPVPSGEGQKSQYLDVGINLTCRLTEQFGKLFAETRMEVSSFALPEQNADPRSSTMPVLRNTSGQGETQITPGKPQIVTSVDDVNSKKKMQVELTATRID